MSSWGKWNVGGRAFFDKREAVLYASTNGCPDIKWDWHNHVFASFDRTRMGSQPLSQLYKQRAQQLRDTYDHLVLFYSGGADSHTILMTFINNNIKLDQIYVNWPKSTIRNGVYVPNTADTTAKNLLSEWDFVVEPTLKWLSETHPEIHIEVGDWSEGINEHYYKDDKFLETSVFWGAGALLRNLNKPKLATTMLDKGKKVASIYGFDKPFVATWGDGMVGMYFTDITFHIASNTVGAFEPFYWAPAMPELPFEMAYQMYLFYKQNPSAQQYMWREPLAHHRNTIVEYNNELTKRICYKDTWDLNKFQAGKPTTAARTDRDFWLYESPEFERTIDAWKYHYTGLLDGIDKSYHGDSASLKSSRTPAFTIGKL